MKLLTSFMMIVFLCFPLSYAQEVATIEDIFPDHEMSWQIEDTSAKGWVYIGKDYFGVSTPFNQSGCIDFYKHYTIEGELLWTSTNIVNDFWNITISRNGNRIMVDRKVYDNGKFNHNLAEVYDENGKHLFTSPIENYYFKSFPDGNCFFTKPMLDTPNKLVILGEHGNLINGENMTLQLEGLVEAIDDSLLLIVDHNKMLIFNVRSSSALYNTSLPSIFHNPRIVYSHTDKTIILWRDHDILVFDINFDMLSNFNINKNSFIQLVQITDDSKFLTLIAYENSQCYFIVYKIDGTLIDQIEYNLPEGEIFSHFSGMSTSGELDVNDNIIIHRYTGANRLTEEKLRYRSTIFTLDSETKKTAAQFTINSWLYHTLKDDGFIEVNDKYIKGWARKEK